MWKYLNTRICLHILMQQCKDFVQNTEKYIFSLTCVYIVTILTIALGKLN